MTTKSANTRITLLHAAARLIAQSGAQTLTLDAVAASAGVSKGGLLYHFPSKESLIAGMVDFFIQQFEARIETFRSQDTSHTPEAAWCRAYVLATLAPAGDEFDVSAGLIAAIANNPALLDPLRQKYIEWQTNLSRALSPTNVLLVRYALDGWWNAQMFGIAPLYSDDAASLQAALLNIIEEKS